MVYVPAILLGLEFVFKHRGAVREDQAALGSAFEDQLHLLGHVRSSGMVGKSGVRVGEQYNQDYVFSHARHGRPWSGVTGQLHTLAM